MPRAGAAQAAAGRLPQLALLAVLLCAMMIAPTTAQTPKGLIERLKPRNLTLADLGQRCSPETEPTAAGSVALRGGITGECVLEGRILPDEIILLSVEVPPKGAPVTPTDLPVGTYDLMAQLRAVGGTLQLGLVAPGNVVPPASQFAQDMVYATRENSEKYFGLSGEFLAAYPGLYTINITSDSDTPVLFTLQLHTPPANVRLHPDEVAVMEELRQRCCPAGVTGTLCTKILPSVTSLARSPGEDMCRLPPNNCGPTGRLRQLILAGQGLDCGAQGLPPSISRLTELHTLDMAMNKIGGSPSQLADIVTKLPTLRRLYMRHTNLTGPIDCGLVNNPSLEVASLSGNLAMTGELPACFLTDATLQELFISFTGLTGPLPDVVPAGSPLRVLFVIGSVGRGGPELTGPIPNSLNNAQQLTFLDLSNNGFDGAVPPLPDSLRFVNLSANALTHMPPTLPASIVIFDASYNSIGGNVPTIPYNLVHLDMRENDLEGNMPTFAGVGGRRRSARRLAWKERPVLDASKPNPAIPLREEDNGAPKLRVFNVALNRLTGSLPAEWATTPRNLHTLDLGNNDISSTLPTQWDLPQLVWLSMEGNLFEGSLPASLGSLPSLVHVNLKSNVLGGELGPFAEALDSGSERLVFLDLSDNYFEGPLPQAFQDSSILNSVSVVVLDGVPARRLFDVSNNSFSGGPFPMWLVESLFTERDNCGGCEIKVAVNGEAEDLACPTKEEADPYNEVLLIPGAIETLRDYNFMCTAGNGTRVPVLSVMDGSAPGPRVRTAGKGPAPGAVGAAISQSGGGGGGGGGKGSGKLPAGAIAGIVVGSVAGAALMAAAAIFGERATRRWRQGWKKERLNGAGEAMPIGGGTARRRPVGAGWGSRVAAREADNAFGVLPPVKELPQSTNPSA